MPPSAVRRPARPSLGDAPFRLTLAYRPPIAWDALLAVLAAEAVAGVDLVEGRRYARTLSVDGHAGVVTVEDVASTDPSFASRGQSAHLVAHVSQSLVPVLMPLLSRLRHLLDLDAEPAAIDAHLTQGGLGALVARRPGLRVPGAVDGFDVALRVILGRKAGRVVEALGERLETGIAGLDRLPPSAKAIVDAGIDRLVDLGVHPRRAESLMSVARSIVDGTLQLQPGRSIAATHRALSAISGIGTVTATTIIARALDWPDAFATMDRRLIARAESWRPWRAYAALHLKFSESKTD
jgi:AraC family transcriptional regulator of adaptative response / DNA-3-methyladenine glycosylase II